MCTANSSAGFELDGTWSDVPSVMGFDTLLCLVRVCSAEEGLAITNIREVMLKSEKASSGDCAIRESKAEEKGVEVGSSVFNLETLSDTCHEDEYSTASLK